MHGSGGFRLPPRPAPPVWRHAHLRLSGDGINGLIGARERIAFVQVRHEEMAAFMACAHAKFTGEVGVCLATSGPGAIHLHHLVRCVKRDSADQHRHATAGVQHVRSAPPRQARSCLRFRSGMSARSVSAASPTRLTSIG